MRNLILVERPGCEVGFAGLVQEHPEREWTLVTVRARLASSGGIDALKDSAACLGVAQHNCLKCPPLPDDLLPVDFVAARLRTLGKFDRVYTHSFMSDNWGECITAVAAATVYEDIWIPSDARPPDKVIVLTPEQLCVSRLPCNTSKRRTSACPRFVLRPNRPVSTCSQCSAVGPEDRSDQLLARSLHRQHAADCTSCRG